MTSIQTSLSIVNGSLLEYDKEYKESIENIKSGKKAVKEIENAPEFLGKLGISEDSNYWINKRLSQYYNVGPFYLDNK